MDSNAQMIRDDLHPIREALIRADKAFAALTRTPWFIDAGLGSEIKVMGARQAIEKALSTPLRNCDVGTAEEQFERHTKWCVETKDFSCDDRICRKCFAEWSQMPYESEVK